MINVLVTGFGPFPGAPFNPSANLVKALVRRRRPALDGIVFTSHIFSTTYAAVDRDLPKLLAAKPDIVLMFGVAGRRRALCIETRARNAVSLLFPDAEGYRPQHGSISPRRPSTLKGNAPFVHMLAATGTSAVPARLSRDAGRYLCNYVYWRALENVCGDRPMVQFVHIPLMKAAKHAQFIAAAEAILIALAAASRH
ncbi:MAG TPA: pyroglutamyl-peptidase I [Xanthobacteraceae bacterium]|jgi:pyroglutamyl-peptidase|nr:pyroglutamyl-peptidase I [Xanthobacteraceae bacterium]